MTAMDTLALLCNLHADGPATLQRLRRVGCESLAGLRRLEPVALVRELGWGEGQALRFLREARLLAERTEGPLSSEAEESFELESSLVEALDGGHDDAEEQAPEAELEPLEEAPAEAPAEAGVEALLGAWRELDRVSPPRAPEDFVIPRPPRARGDRRLEELALEGLTPELVARLAGKGVRTLVELCEVGELELARALGLGLTRVKRLQFQARRVLAQELAAPAAEADSAQGATASRFEAYNPPPAEPFETAGPFA
jgi:hypothetical protein